MLRLRLRSSLLSVSCCCVAITSATASPRVYPPYCTAPSAVRLVGTNGGVPDRVAGEFQIVIRDFVNNPTPGASVVIDLSGTPDVVLCAEQADPNALTSCPGHSVLKFTDGLGQVTFTLLGSSTGASDPAATGLPARIFANGVLVREISVSTFDLDGASGVGATDLSIWLTDFGSDTYHQRSDFDASGGDGANDLSEWLTMFGAGGSTQSCGASCP